MEQRHKKKYLPQLRKEMEEMWKINLRGRLGRLRVAGEAGATGEEVAGRPPLPPNPPPAYKADLEGEGLLEKQEVVGKMMLTIQPLLQIHPFFLIHHRETMEIF